MSRRTAIRPLARLAVYMLCAALALLALGHLRGSAEAAAARPSRGVYVAFCPRKGAPPRARRSSVASPPRASAALASHAGWPPDQCLEMDKGSYAVNRTLVGDKHVHNWLLGGYGNDTIWAGEEGDVMWGDYQPSGQSESEHNRLHGGPGPDWIYSSHGYDEIWTGAGTDHLALIYGHGVVHCDGPGLKILVMRYLPQNRHWHLVGCSHIRIDRYRA